MVGVQFSRLSVLALTASLLIAGCSAQTVAPPPPGPPDNLWQLAREEQPNEPWVVGMGDSYISGEAGAWASNGADNAEYSGFGGWLLGSDDQVYGDSPEGTESIPFCHRSATAPMFVGSGYNVKNLACSGATTASAIDSLGRIKPGIDFVDVATTNGRATGQALDLQNFAKDHDVKVVALSIIGNDIGFSNIIAICVTAFLTPGAENDCNSSPAVGQYYNPVARTQYIERVATAVQNINTAMTNAGKSPKDWRLIYDMYPIPVPTSKEIAFDQSYARQAEGGCGMFNADLDWSNSTLMPWIYDIIATGVRQARTDNPRLAPVTLLDNRNTLDGHRLCEIGTQRPPASTGIPPNSLGDDTEWVRFLSLVVSEFHASSPRAIEMMHPNYFGQRAIASCVRAVIDYPGTPAALACSPQGDVTYDAQTPPLLTNLRVAEVKDKFIPGS